MSDPATAAARAGSVRFRAVDPRTGTEVEPWFECATPAEVDATAERAWRAFESYGALGGGARGVLLETAAAELEGVERALVARASLETGLTEERLGREFARTVSTLRMFAGVVRDGSWVRAAIDHPAPGAAPGTIPAHDLRRMLVPLGPVAVFGASNFPLAYGVAGGDTASALAAGCPVIVKGHPSHPGTGELAAAALSRAVKRCGLDAGVFSYLPSGGARENDVGARLVAHPFVRAVGFTGSFGGGMALERAARERRESIPVFAEMGSANPVFVLPGAAGERGGAIAEQLAGSILDSSGQQCTCPGIVFVIDGAPGAREVVDALAARLDGAPENVMLSRRVRAGYVKRVRECLEVSGVEATEALGAFVRGEVSDEGPIVAPAGMLRTSMAEFREAETLREEVFGPAVIVVGCASEGEMLEAAGLVRGSLTASVFGATSDTDFARTLTRRLSAKAGRVVWNGVPTGVRVASSMVHGGPYPATNRPETTAVGAFAIERWTRAVCYQNAAPELMPEVLRESGGHGVRRLVDGEFGCC